MLNLIVPELAHFALILALVMSLMQAVIPMVGYKLNSNTLIQSAGGLALGQSFNLIICFFGLMYSFYANDFSVLYVASNSHTDLGVIYRLCALWGAHEGSLVLWVSLLGLWTLLVTLCSKELESKFRAVILSTLGAISFGFCLFILYTSNPFLRILPEYPLQGADLNPLLQDPGFVVHPPLLYTGYVGLAVPFAFAIAALVTGKLIPTQIAWIRNWILASWAFLTLGIISGSWWAYYELGWGGWWFWDPVENASLMPWLIATALLHSVIVTQQRGIFTAWTLLLSIFAFSLSLMGTFLVRSGVLTSVHAFASDPERGLFVLVFLSIVIGTALILFALKGNLFKEQKNAPLSNTNFASTSKESLMLVNNILLTLCMSTVLVGTLYPLVIETLGLPAISVGPPFFNKVFIPLMVPVIFSMVLGSHASWVQGLSTKIQLRLRWIFASSIMVSIASGVLLNSHSTMLMMLGMASSFWLLVGTLSSLIQRLKSTINVGPSFLGMVIAHIGLAVSIIGISCTSNFDIEKDVRVSLNDSVNVGAYEFTLTSLTPIEGGNYNGTKAKFEIKEIEDTAGTKRAEGSNSADNKRNNTKMVGVLYPEKRFFHARNMPMSEAAILPLLTKDLYIALGEELSPNTWSARLYIKPFVRLMWLGGLMMAFGAFMSIFARVREKRKLKTK